MSEANAYVVVEGGIVQDQSEGVIVIDLDILDYKSEPGLYTLMDIEGLLDRADEVEHLSPGWARSIRRQVVNYIGEHCGISEITEGILDRATP
jgi:hypothetical protein